jgi:hypothetical protein
MNDQQNLCLVASGPQNRLAQSVESRYSSQNPSMSRPSMSLIDLPQMFEKNLPR